MCDNICGQVENVFVKPVKRVEEQNDKHDRRKPDEASDRVRITYAGREYFSAGI